MLVVLSGIHLIVVDFIIVNLPFQKMRKCSNLMRLLCNAVHPSMHRNPNWDGINKEEGKESALAYADVSMALCGGIASWSSVETTD